MNIVALVFDKCGIKYAAESSSVNYGVEAFPVETSEEKPEEKDITPPQDYKAYYEFYRTSPSKKTLSAVLKSLKPTIDYAVLQNGGKGNPFVESSAKLIAAESVKRYDPKFNTSLPTFISSNLRKLTRIVRDANQPVRIPESYIYDLAAVNKAEAEFVDKYGRDPDMSELSDMTNMSIKKITKLRNKFFKQVSEGQFYEGHVDMDGSSSDSQTSVDDSAGQAPDFTKEAMEYAYKDFNHNEKKVLEWTSGYGGNPILTTDQIASRLKMSPSQINRISNKIAETVNTYTNALAEVYGG